MISATKSSACARSNFNHRRSLRPAVEALEGRLLLATYYVATNGIDSNSGTLAAPFATINRGMQAAQPGDTVYLRKGTYRETITAVRSGLSGSPITVTSYNGEAVYVTGSNLVTGTWTETPAGSGIYAVTSTTVSSLDPAKSAFTDQIFVSGQMMVAARFPNVPYNATSGFDLLSPPLASATMPASSSVMSVPSATQAAGFWNGATVWAKIGGAWAAQTATVVSSSPGSLTLTNKSTPWFPDISSYYGNTGGVYLTGKLAALDAPGEWYIQGNTLYLKMPNGGKPSDHVVEIKRRTLVADLGTWNNITLSKLRFLAGSIEVNGNNNRIEDCTFRYVSQLPSSGWYGSSGGLHIAGTGNVLTRSVVDTSSSNGIRLGGSYNTISQSLIRNVNYNGDYSAAVTLQGNHNTIERSTMSRSGRYIISPGGAADIIRYNDLSDSMMLTNDGGAIYVWGHDGQGTEIAHNWIHSARTNVVGDGVYLDDGTSNYLVHHNVIWDSSDGIRLGHVNSSSGHQIYNNTLWGNRNHDMAQHGSASLTNIRVYNNLADRNDFLGTDLQKNLYATDAKFVDLANHDYRIAANSPAIDYGRVIAGITDGYVGLAPDTGAYEYGATWRPGADLAALMNLLAPVIESVVINDGNVQRSMVKNLTVVFSEPVNAASGLSVVRTDSPLSGQVAYYSMNQGTGSTLTDDSGNGNAGYLTAGPTWGTRDGGGSALNFDGVDDYVRIPDASSLDMMTAITVAGWFNHSSTGGSGASGIDKQFAYRLLAMENNASASRWQFLLRDPSQNYHLAQTTATYSNDQWHYVVGTYDGATIKLYVDGALAASTAWVGTIANSASALELGRRDGSGNAFYAGRIDDVRLLNRAMTAAEVAAYSVAVTSTPSADMKTWVLTFSGAAVVNGSLPDGVYQVLATTAVKDLAGNSLASNYTSAKFHRLYGDSDGNASVDALDLYRFRQCYLTSSGSSAFNALFDSDGNGSIDALDLFRFRNNYLKSYSY